jgi:hypothetical protein
MGMHTQRVNEHKARQKMALVEYIIFNFSKFLIQMFGVLGM